jgi:hypothetical protein
MQSFANSSIFSPSPSTLIKIPLFFESRKSKTSVFNVYTSPYGTLSNFYLFSSIFSIIFLIKKMP